MARIAINGFGRIGRAAFKIALETPQLEVVAINDLVPADNLAYLLKYDSVYGRYEKEVHAEGDAVVVDGKAYPLLHEKDPEKLPWRDKEVDIVLECSGHFTDKDGMGKHLKAGALYVLLSAPAKGEEIVTVIPGVNAIPDDAVRMVSCASCTTNSIAPVMEVLGRRIGINKAVMTTFHAYTSSQALVDSPNKKFRRGRAAALSFVPSTTGAAVATARALPQFKGKFDGTAIRAPIPVGSISDIVAVSSRATSADEINAVFREEAASERYRDIMGISEDEIVSSDIVKDPRAAIIDLTMTKVVDGDLIKVMSWYDNEWGYTHQLVREASKIARDPAALEEKRKAMLVSR